MPEREPPYKRAEIVASRLVTALAEEGISLETAADMVGDDPAELRSRIFGAAPLYVRDVVAIAYITGEFAGPLFAPAWTPTALVP